jgi:hypothetical protein
LTDQAKKIVPVQRKGGKSSTHYSIRASDLNAARELFKNARMNLLNVNKWHELAGALSATFQLTDEKGDAINDYAKKGNYFSISIPGAPGHSGDDGNDWVKVEKIEEQKNNNEEWIAIRVRPAKSPLQHNSAETTHFFTDDASSSFCLERKGRKVTASIYGRNEKPNIKTKTLTDKIRNAIIAFGAMVGLSKSQWTSLVKGILEK